jgi:hypothetical protein
VVHTKFGCTTNFPFYNNAIPSGLGIEPVIHIFYNIFIPTGLNNATGKTNKKSGIGN